MTIESRSRRDAGSFRDPSGYVFRYRDRIFRAIDRDSARLLREVRDSGLLGRLVKEHLLVGTTFVEDPVVLGMLRGEHAGYDDFLEHEPVYPITFPYEWSISMLGDSAELTLELQERLLNAGLSLKDATPYDVQFVRGRPVFIDVTSIERPPRLDIWLALGQFGQMFTFPLLLQRYYGWDLKSYFLGSLAGRDLEQVARSLGRLGIWRPRNLLDVGLARLLHRKASRSTCDETLKSRLAQGNTDKHPQLINLRRLRAKIRDLAGGYWPGSHWAGYTATSSYEDRSEAAKKEMVARQLEAIRPSSVLDLGCNRGDYTRIAAEAGARVIAVDSDHDAIELLYHRLRREPAPISPMVLDLSNPSPAIGHLNRERPSFLERIDANCVLALALIHHLHVSGNLPLGSICDLFAALTRRHLILEFVPTDDVMFRKLTAFRSLSYQDFTLAGCRVAFASAYEIVQQLPIPDSPRTLLLMAKKG